MEIQTYIIGIVIIEILTGWWYKIPDLAQLLSFGLSLSSLVLAVIAIIQAIVSGSSFSQIIGSITASVNEVRSAATQIGQASSQLLQQAAAIPSVLGEMSSRLDQALNRPSTEAATQAPAATIHSEKTGEITIQIDNIDSVLDRATFGGIMAYYVSVLSFENRKSYDPLTILSDDPSGGYYIQGFISAAVSYGILTVTRTGTPENENIFLVNDLGILNAAKIKERISNHNDSLIKKYKPIVEKYFQNG